MTRPRVALVAHGVHDGGGMERALAELVRAAADEIAFRVVATTIADDIRQLAECHEVRVPIRPVPLFFSSFYTRAGLALGRVDADLVHSMGAIQPRPVDLVSVQFCHRAFADLPGEVRSVPGGRLRNLNRRLDLAVSLAAERRGYRPDRVQTFAAASAGVARELAEHYPGIPAEVVPNGFSPERLDPATHPPRAELRRALGYGEDDLLVLFLGGDWRRKGLEPAIEGVAHAAGKGVSKLRLAVVGRGDRGPYARRAADLRLADRVRFHGPTDQPERFLLASDVFLFPTAYEAFPLVAIEAAAAGLPIIATPVNGIRELIADGTSGWIVDRHAASIGDALVRAAANPAERRAMGSAARAAAAGYTWRSMATSTLGLYDRLLSAA